MRQLSKLSKGLLAAGAAALLVGSLAYAESPATASTKPKTTPRDSVHKTTGSTFKTHTPSKPHTTSKSAKSSNASHAKSTKAGAHKGKRSRKTARGQQKIDEDRTHQIQEALIRQHYLNGEPSGKWDASTEDSLRRYQADNGWQNKTVPDSRALIKLGLGPSHDHLLNPESAMTSAPEAPRATAAPNATSPSGPSAPPTQPQ
jgi:hypothetical protein